MWTVLNSVLSTVLLGEARDLDKQPQCIPSFMDCTSCSTVTIKQVKKRKEYSPRTLPFLQVGAGQDCRTGFIDSKTGGKQTRTRGASTCQRLLSTNKNFYGTCADKMPLCCTFDVQRYLQPSRKFFDRGGLGTPFTSFMLRRLPRLRAFSSPVLIVFLCRCEKRWALRRN